MADKPRYRPRYEVRLLDRDHRPITNWQWCPDPRPEPLTGRMGLALTFQVPPLQVTRKGIAESIEIQLDKRAIFVAQLIRVGPVRRGDTVNIDDLHITMEGR